MISNAIYIGYCEEDDSAVIAILSLNHTEQDNDK